MRNMILLVLALGMIAQVAPAEEVWTGPSIVFTRAENVDGWDPANMDQITDNVWITRLTGGGSIWNYVQDQAVMENFTPCSGPYPTDTEWAFGDIADYDTLDYGPFLSAAFADCWPFNMLNPSLPGVLHLISEDIYIPIQFTYWSSGGTGGFQYTRGTREGVAADGSSWSSVKALFE